MATVRAFRIPGVRCWFWSNDHDPPHFHAKKNGQWEVRVRFLEPARAMIEYVAWSVRALSRGERQELVHLAAAHRAELLRQWETIQERDHG